jgi:hypothetical protein
VAKKRKFDIENFSNTVKQILPGFVDLTAGFNANQGNFFQGEMDDLMDPTVMRDKNGLTPMEAFFSVKDQ